MLSAEIEILPTTTDNFQAEIAQVGANRLVTQHIQVASPQVSTVAYKSDYQSIDFLTETNSSRLQHCGMEVLPGDIIVSGLEVIHRRSGLNLAYGSISLPITDWHSAFAAIIGRDFAPRAGQSIVRPPQQPMSRLLMLYNAVVHFARHTPDILEVPEVVRAVESELIHVMTRCLGEGTAVATSKGNRRREAIIARLEELLAANPDRPLYLTEICAGIGVAERTLRAACEEHLGMGPIRYLTLRRMHLVRRALIGADAARTNVTRVVTDHGFWELGRFSVAYRAMFGESPSETLRRQTERKGSPLIVSPASLPTMLGQFCTKRQKPLFADIAGAAPAQVAGSRPDPLRNCDL
jgi:AraC-like DNA-binding protein